MIPRNIAKDAKTKQQHASLESFDKPEEPLLYSQLDWECDVG